MKTNTLDTHANEGRSPDVGTGDLVSHLAILERVRSAQQHFDCLAAGELGAECRSAAADGLLKSIGYVTVCDADGFHTDDEDEGFVLTDAGRAVLAAEDDRRDRGFRAHMANNRDVPTSGTNGEQTQ